MSQGRSVLVVEDDQDARDTMEEILLADGFEVDTAADGDKALRKIQDKRYDLAIVDLMLPDSDGVLLRGRIQKTDPELSSRLIFTTGFTTQRDVVAYLTHAGSAFLAKPFRPNELIDAVRRSLAPEEEEEK